MTIFTASLIVCSVSRGMIPFMLAMGSTGSESSAGFFCGQGVLPLFEQVELLLQRFDLLAELFGIRCRLQVFTGVRGRLRMVVLCRCRRGEQQRRRQR